MTTEIMDKAIAMKDYATKVRRYLHENAELSLQEYNTTTFIKNELVSMGIEIMPLSIQTGVVGIIKGTKSGKNIVTALRADIDALPINEQTGKAYASKTPGVMHACGHDGHTAILLGVAKLLSTMTDSFSGVVKLIFQPAEEIFRGSKEIIDAGALKDPDVDNIVCLHGWPQFKVGQVGAWPGQYMASADTFKVKMTGKGGHGCRPYKAVNSIVAASMAVIAIQNIVSSEITTAQQAVISVCMFNAGTAINIIPDEVVFGGTVRCLDEGVRQELKKRIERVIKGSAAAMNCTCQIDYTFGVPSLVNDPGIVHNLMTAASDVLGEDHVVELDGPVMGSEDFSYYINEIGKGAFYRLGIGDEGQEERVLHNSKFDFNDDALPIGIATMIQYVLNTNK